MKFSIDIDNCEAISNKFELIPDKVRQNSAALESVSDCLILCGPEYEIIKATLDACIKNLSREAVETANIYKAFKQIIEKYKSADKTIVAHTKGGNKHLPNTNHGKGHSQHPNNSGGNTGITWPSGSGSARSNIPEKRHGKEKEGSGIFDTYFLFREPTANAGGSYEYDTDPSNAHVNAEGEAHAYGPSILFGYSLFNNFITADTESTYLYSEHEGKVGLSLFDENGNFHPHITGNGNSNTSIYHTDQKFKIGTDMWNFRLKRTEDTGYVSGEVEYSSGTPGVVSYGAGIEKESVTQGFTIWGLDVDTTECVGIGAKGQGAIGHGYGVCVDENHARIAFEIGKGVAVGIDINIDWSDCPAYQWAKDLF
ncbi:hypothetical protein [Butyrivibrio sp. NC2002]|uniref:hypothetical protein n=1 Tax=Butyrivibrio sp. NC2002 TaxID=1410610 RepID=UPI0005621FF6|nr:hypothetical protein [Butyrivibrio sp. NC2002]